VLIECGYRVRTLSRDAPRPGWLPDGVDVHTGDVTDRSAVQSALQGVDSVIHMAALLHIVEPPPGLREAYRRINVGGTALVVEEAVRQGTRRIVLSSTIAVYGDAHKQVLTEDVVPNPDTLYAQTKLAAEKIVLEAAGPDGQPLGVALRLSAVYGPRMKGNYRRLVLSLANGRFMPIGDGANRRTLVFDRDVARAAVLALHHPAAAGRAYNVTDGRFHTMREIIQTICNALGRTPPRFSLPVGLARLGAGVLEDAARMAGRQAPVGRASIDKYTEDVAVSGQRIETELGFVPQFDLACGWQETVNEIRQAGELVRPHA
jgi:nucleoside-diphosphate-sugar epimerase